MALNNSGPISLGGATVGQSINLELGNSATALASINSTPFRTLAGVASGQITLSNFYGKSSNSYWALSAQDTTLGTGFAVSVNGVLCIESGQGFASYASRELYFFGSDGALTKVTATNPPTTTTVRVSAVTNNNSTSAPVYYGVMGSEFTTSGGTIFGFASFNSTTNTNLFTGNSWKRFSSLRSANDGSKQGILVDSSSNIYVIPKNPVAGGGKAYYYQTAYASYTSSGTERYSYRQASSEQAAAQWRGSNIGALRSDNKFVVVGFADGTNTGLYEVNASTGSNELPRRYSNDTCRQSFGQVLIDSSNNIYMCRTNADYKPVILKLNSAYAVVAGKYINPNSPAGSQIWETCSAMYNDTIYTYATTGTANAISVVSINSSTLNPIWSLKLTFSDINVLNTAFQTEGQTAIRVTSVGIYIGVAINKAGIIYKCFIKLPLDGNLSGTKTITLASGVTCNVAFSYQTTAWTANDFTFAFSGNAFFAAGPYSGAATAGSTPTTGTNPTTSLTAL